MEAFKQMKEGQLSLTILPWAERFPQLASGFSLRGGGVSIAPFAGLNVAAHVGDDPNHVRQNRNRLVKELGFAYESWTCATQIHGSDVWEVVAEDVGKGRLGQEDAISDADGLYTRLKGVLLASFYADCVPLYFFDPEHEVIGLAHAGWRGTVADIAGNMIRTWMDRFGSNPANIWAAIGPSIGRCCYEVDGLVASPVSALLGKKTDGVLFPSKDNKWLLDLREANRLIMIEAGIPAAHIEVTEWCTSCHADLFFSYRRDKGKTGRMASFIGMK